MQLLAPAKINLYLRVGRRRDDGFHPLLTWMCTVGLFDKLTLEADPDAVTMAPATPPPVSGTLRQAIRANAIRMGEGATAPARDDDVSDDGIDAAAADVELVLCGDGDRPDLPRDASNLVVRIATAFVDEVRRERGGREPVAPGPSGASAQQPASREGGFQGPQSPPAARAAPAKGQGSTASAGAAPQIAPGTVREDPGAADDSRQDGDPTVGRPPGRGAGAVRGAEGSGRSNRRRQSVHGSVPGPRAAGRPAVRFSLEKLIPIGAGLGGGSSDAAFALVALDRLMATGWSAERLSGFAARFGSDVPFFVHAALGAASGACRGRGEIIRPVRRPGARWAVVFSPPFPLATRDVYARFDGMGLGSDAVLEAGAEPDWDAWAGLGSRELLERLVNDLEPAAFSLSPDLAGLRERLQHDIGRVVRMSGSGSSLFTLFDASEERAALKAAEAGRGRGAAAVVAEIAPGAAGI